MNSLIIYNVLEGRDDDGADVLQLGDFIQRIGETMLTVLPLGGKLEQDTIKVLVASLQV
jgi:hypothetical protein